MQNVVLEDSLGHQMGCCLDHSSPIAFLREHSLLDVVASVN